MVTSKFSFWNIYFLYTLLLGCFAGGCYLIVHSEKQFKTKMGFTTNGTVVGLLLCGLVAYFIYHALKYTKQLRVEEEGIYIRSLLKTRYIPKAAIQSINLTGRINLGLLSQHKPTGALIIELKNGEQLTFADYWYRNNAVMKQSLQYYLQPTTSSAGTAMATTDHPLPLDLTGMPKFAGNHFLSINGIILYGISFFWVFAAVGIFRHPAPANGHPILAGSVFLLIWAIFVIALGSQLHYFLLSENYLVVKNHLFIWKKRIFPLADIREVIIETPYRRSTTLVIITKDFSQKKYAAGSLRNKTWKALRERLQAYRIPVTNEA
ncbi:MAG: hypothetical protein QM731_17070 [Chitinophagaceae bacterium]